MKLHQMFLLCLMLVVVRCIDPETAYLLTPLQEMGEKCGYEACPITAEGQINVHIIAHSHAELGSTATFYEHYTGHNDFYDKININMKRILDASISELWAKKYRRFTLSDPELPYFFYWWSRRDGTVRRMVYELIRQGRLVVVGGGWGMPDEATTSYQAIIDSYTYSLRKLNATFMSCALPTVAWQADVLGHSKEFASLVAQMGFDGLFINPISYDDELIRMERKALEFVWRGSDDLGTETDVYTHKLFDGYWFPPGFCFGSLCSDPLLVSSDSLFRNIEERVNAFMQSVRFRQAPYYNTNHIMVILGHKFGYYTAKMWFENIDKLINEVNRKSTRDGDKVNLMYSTPACYLKSVHSENPVLETKQDDFFPLAYDKHSYTTGMYTTQPKFKYLVREANIYLQITKQLQVLVNTINVDKFLENFMWIVGIVQDHNIISGGMLNNVRDYYAEKLSNKIEESVGILEHVFRAHGYPSSSKYHRCRLNESLCQHIRDKFHIIIYNSLAWTVHTFVRLPIKKHDYRVYAPNGNLTQSFIVPTSEHVRKISNGSEYELIFAVDIPPLGYKSYYIQTDKRITRSVANILRNGQEFSSHQNSNECKNSQDEEKKRERRREFDLDRMVEDIIDTTKNIDAEEYLTTDNVYNNETIKEHITEKSTKILEGELNKEENYRKMMNPLSQDGFIKNQYIQIDLDRDKKISNIKLSNGISTSLDIQYFYYVSDDPEQLGEKRKKPGLYIFRSIDKNEEPIIDAFDTKIYKNDLVEEIHMTYSNYASIQVRLYKDSPIVEIFWVLGPIPEEDGLGKEVFIRYMTDLENNGAFYTDANGRQSVKRIRNLRATYESYNFDPIAGNFYPVTSRIYIEDLKKDMRLSIFNDRAQGGTSLYEGAIDLMLQRHIFTDDSGYPPQLNGSNSDIVTGTHYLYLTKASHKPNRIFEKKFAKEVELKPQIMFANDKLLVKEKWLNLKNEFSALKNKLPIGIHILTIQEWNDKTILLRFENYLEKIDTVKNGTKHIKIHNLFNNIKIKKIKETTLAGHLWLNEWTPLRWQLKNKFVKSFNEFYGSNTTEYMEEKDLKTIDNVDVREGILLIPQQIRTFVVWYDFIK